MKTIYKIGIPLFLAIAIFSCNDEFLDKTPRGAKYSLGNAYLSEPTLIAALNGTYSLLQKHNSMMVVNQLIIGDMMSDNADGVGGDVWVQTFKNYDYDAASEIPSYDPLSAGFFNFDDMIGNANNVITLGDISNKKMEARIKAEAYFLRGHAYYWLATNYGGFPIYTEPIGNVDDLYRPRNSIQETFEQAESDFLTAIEGLPLKSEYPSADLGRATKGAAQTHLAKNYLMMASWLTFDINNVRIRDFKQNSGLSAQEYWEKAETFANYVIESGEYELVPDSLYGSNFDMTGDNNIESVFETQFGDHFYISRRPMNGEYNSVMPHLAASEMAFNCAAIFEIFSVTAEQAGIFDQTNDIRFAATLLSPGDSILWQDLDGQPYVITDAGRGWTPGGYTPRKYIVPETNRANGDCWLGQHNIKGFRYSNVLLIHAEAANEANHKDAAIESINKVRRRANIVELTAALSKEALRDSIRLDRQRELMFEGFRWWDLVRWGIAPEKVGADGFVEGRHELFPIPQFEIDMNPSLTQNPGY